MQSAGSCGRLCTKDSPAPAIESAQLTVHWTPLFVPRRDQAAKLELDVLSSRLSIHIQVVITKS